MEDQTCGAGPDPTPPLTFLTNPYPNPWAALCYRITHFSSLWVSLMVSQESWSQVRLHPLDFWLWNMVYSDNNRTIILYWKLCFSYPGYFNPLLLCRYRDRMFGGETQARPFYSAGGSVFGKQLWFPPSSITAAFLTAVQHCIQVHTLPITTVWQCCPVHNAESTLPFPKCCKTTQKLAAAPLR